MVPAKICSMKITAVLLAEEIAADLPFWVDRMGFAKTVEVPDGNRLSFVILARDGAELMLQSVESVGKDVAAFAPVNECAVWGRLPHAKTLIDGGHAACDAHAKGRSEIELIDIAGANPLVDLSDTLSVVGLGD